MQKFNGEHGDFFQTTLVHTGQHYDYKMSKIFFRDLELPEPDIYLGVGSGTHAEQTGKVMIESEKVLSQKKSDLVVVVGDVNSTLAVALAAVKLRIPLAHIEAGIRMFNRDIPEEINRLLTDAISDYLFTPSLKAGENLEKEGIPREKVFLVGNIMIDSLLHNRKRAEQSPILSQLDLRQGEYALLTLHRPGNVDQKESLTDILTAIGTISQRIPVVFPVHPRTRNKMKDFDLFNQPGRNSPFLLIEPLGYLDFLNLMMNAKFVMTDSGGIEAETTVLGIPCLTLLDITGWEETVNQGTNVLVGSDGQKLKEEAFKILDGITRPSHYPELWDGKTAERIIRVLSR
jgi:UDP-N-acetylglucosamine 2-epimerase (non-hydrolysing)